MRSAVATLLVLLVCGAEAPGEAERAAARVARDVVLQGQPVEIEISVVGPRAVDAELEELPEVEGLRFLEVEGPEFARRASLAGEGATYEATFRVRAQAVRAGRIVVPPFSVLVASDERVRTNRLDLLVVARDELPAIRFLLEGDPPRVFAGQPLALRFRLEVEGQYANALSSGLSRFVLPWWQEVLPFTDRGALVPGRGEQRRFPIEGGNRSLFLEVRERADPADPRSRERLEGTVIAVPRAPGRLELERSRFRAAFVVGTGVGRVSDDGIVRSEVPAEGAAAVEVRPLPVDGRPARFSGIVGRVRLTVDLDRTRLRVGEALHAVIALEELRPDSTNLRFAKLDELRRVTGFRTFACEEAREGGRREWSLELAPESADVDRFPALEVSFFDPDRERYGVTRTEAIPLEVRPAAGAGGRGEGGAGWRLAPAAAVALVLGAATLGLFVVLRLRRERRGGRDEGGASPEPITLEALAAELEQADPIAAGRAFARFVAERTGVPAARLFGSEGASLLEEAGLRGELVVRVRRLYERAERAAFSGRSEEPPGAREWLEAARALDEALAGRRV